jgi:hypothetical protein
VVRQDGALAPPGRCRCFCSVLCAAVLRKTGKNM